MRFILIALILASFPLMMSWLRTNPQRRSLAFTALGLMLFLGSAIKIDGAIIAWPMWMGTVRGMQIGFNDALALALIMTRKRLPGKLRFWPLFGFYGAALVVSIVPSTVPMATIFSCWQFARVVLVFAAIGGECHRKDTRDALLTGLALGLMLQAGYVAQQKATGVIQATGTMLHQNVLGLMVEFAIIPILAALLAGDRRGVMLAGAGAGLFVIACGGSRGAMSIAGGGIAVLVLLSLIRGVTPAKMRVVGLAVLAMALATPIALATLKDRFGGGSMTAQDDQRPKFEQAARLMAADHPFGVGANMYVSIANTKGYADRAGVAWNFSNRSAPVHNVFLLARAETGWWGEIGLILVLVVPLLAGLRFAFANRQGAGGEMALGSSVALGVNIVHSNYEFALVTYGVMLLAFINIAIIAAELRAARYLKPRARPPATRRAPGGAPVLTPVVR